MDVVRSHYRRCHILHARWNRNEPVIEYPSQFTNVVLIRDFGDIVDNADTWLATILTLFPWEFP